MIKRPVTTRHLNRILKKFGIENQNLPQTPLILPLLSQDKPASTWFKKILLPYHKSCPYIEIAPFLDIRATYRKTGKFSRKEKYRENWEYKWESKAISCLIDTFLGKSVTFPFSSLITHLIDIIFTILIFSEEKI